MSALVKRGIIYRITSPSGKTYIGQTDRSFQVRWNQHCGKSSCCTALHRAIEKYGKENMTKEILCECDVEELKVKENEFIKEFNSLAPHGYNLKMNDDTGRTVYSEETKKRISEGNKKYAQENPRTLTEEQKEHLRQINKGKVMSDESKEKMRESKLNLWRNKEHVSKQSEETKQKIKEGLKKYYESEKYKKSEKYSCAVHFIPIRLTSSDGEGSDFINATEAATFLKCNRRTVLRHKDSIYRGYQIECLEPQRHGININIIEIEKDGETKQFSNCVEAAKFFNCNDGTIRRYIQKEIPIQGYKIKRV